MQAGMMLADALDRLTEELQRVTRRSRSTRHPEERQRVRAKRGPMTGSARLEGCTARMLPSVRGKNAAVALRDGCFAASSG